MNCSFYLYAFVLFVLVVYTLRYAFTNFHCKKCGSWGSEVRPHFEINAGGPHAFVQVRYCCHCDEPIVNVARIEIHEIKDNREKSHDDLPPMFQHQGSHRGGVIDG